MMNEEDLRQVLEAEASRFQPPAQWIEAVTVPKTRHRPLVLKVAGVVTTVAASVALVFWLAPHLDADPEVAAHHAVAISLVGYAAPGDGQREPRLLAAHVACMRAEGFPVSDPVWAHGNWTIEVDRALLTSKRWFQAAFIDCGLRTAGRGPIPPAVSSALTGGKHGAR